MSTKFYMYSATKKVVMYLGPPNTAFKSVLIEMHGSEAKNIDLVYTGSGYGVNTALSGASAVMVDSS
jgi:hypothetical protein